MCMQKSCLKLTHIRQVKAVVNMLGNVALQVGVEPHCRREEMETGGQKLPSMLKTLPAAPCYSTLRTQVNTGCCSFSSPSPKSHKYTYGDEHTYFEKKKHFIEHILLKYSSSQFLKLFIFLGKKKSILMSYKKQIPW